MAEVLGIVAAGTQFFELAATALLKTVRLVKDLRDVPRKMAVLLADVEKSTTRVQYILNDILQPGSIVLEQLNATQADNLTKAATELQQAMDEVNVILTPLVGTQTSGNSKLPQRIWRAVVAVKVEKDVIEKLERVGRLNNEVTQQLGITNVELQAAISDKLRTASITAGNHKSELVDVVETSSRNLQTTIHEKHTFTTTQLSNIASMTWDAQYVMTGVRDSVVATNIGLSRVAEDTTSIRHALATLTDRDQANPISRQEMQDMMSQHASRTDIELLRDEILSLLTRQTSDLPVSSWTGSQNLSKADKRNVQESARQQLLMRPSSLAEAKAALQRDESHVARSCRCRLSRRYRDSRFWRLSFRAEESSEHRRGCPYANSGVRSWSYSARAALTPFLNFTLELAVGATMKGRSWSMAPPLRFHGTVKRSESPLFQAFDRLPSLCIKNVWLEDGPIIYSHDPGRDTAPNFPYTIFLDSVQMQRYLRGLEVVKPDRFEGYYVELDQDTTKQQLVDLCGQVRSEIERGNASGADSDEDGLTLLFSFVDLLFLFRSCADWSLFSAEILSLFHVIVDSGVDMAALAPYSFLNGPKNDLRRRTAGDTLLEMLTNSASDYLEHISVVWESMAAFVTPLSAGRLPLSDLVKFLLWSPQLADSAEELGIINDAEMAVLHRRPSVLKRHSVHWSKHDGHTVMNGPGFELTQLALGWDTGLRYLVAAHCPVEEAIVTACKFGDEESLRILLRTPRPIFSASSIIFKDYKPWTYKPWIVRAVNAIWHSPAGDTCSDLIFTELIRRRDILKHLALTELPSRQQREFGLGEPSNPDSRSEAIFHCLKQIVHVPDELDCWISPYHMIRDCDGMPLKLLDRIYNAGFRSVDIPYEGDTPLLWMLARHVTSWSENSFLGCLPWFLGHGARAEWSNVSQPDNTRYPTALFYIGLIWHDDYAQLSSHFLEACEESSLWVPTNLHLISDDCICLCGTRGCLASHLLWRCTAQACWCFGETIGRRLKVLEDWISVWRLSDHEKEIVYSEVTRLELFERLGMAHTCCCTSLPKIYSPWGPLRRICPDEDERARLRDEDGELALQLDDLLAQYDIARKAHGGSIESFWRHWWQVLDEILPPLLPVEACKNRALRPWDRSPEKYRQRDQETIENRAAREQEALKCAGYIGPAFEDFRQVIRVHLSGRDWDPSVFDDADSEEWETCSSGTDTNASESTDED